MDAEYWNQKYAVDELIYTDEVNRFVKALSEPLIAAAKKPGKMIDLAGGEGRNSVWFAQQGWQAENIDFSKVALSKALKLAEERKVADLYFAHVADATGFESVLTPVDIGVIGYLQIEQPGLNEAIDCLVDNIKRGGHLIGVWHARENLDGGFGGPQNPAVLPTASEMREFLSELPLEIEILENREGQVKTKDGLKPSTTLVLLAKKL
ncbi:bifunctional 2-polyprenyl-6-hydroxyphenol methylase/3-demethylubiquinol 3-O-methyltransferase UbiG [Rhodoluna sp.]|uniref:class I SAM-dependent methyltransferase n=1 Tax=Rhodoluna sp. TaxID=1969481 RepID=UPI0025D72F4D|nr:class I SAM-dependent methyltransferase [Rhodoluna sp.]